MPIKVTAVITGNALNGFTRALKALGGTARKRLREEAIAPTLAEMVAIAQSKVPVSAGGRRGRKAKNRPGPGELRATIRGEMAAGDVAVGYLLVGEGKLRRRSRATTVKGIAKASTRARAARGGAQPLGAYAMAVEYGAPHRGVAAEPFIRPAKEAVRAKLQARSEAALRAAVQDADRIGGK